MDTRTYMGKQKHKKNKINKMKQNENRRKYQAKQINEEILDCKTIKVLKEKRREKGKLSMFSMQRKPPIH